MQEGKHTAQAKGVSKMKETTARQIENMKNQTIGVEVEMYNISRSKAAKIAAEFFGTDNYEDTANEKGHYNLLHTNRL